MHINAHQIWSRISSAPFFCPFNKFWRTSLHCKLVIWDCLSKTKSPHILLIPPLSPPPLPSSPGLTKAGLFKYAHSRRWFVLAREQVPSPARRSGVSAVTLRSWVASFTLTLPRVSWYTYHPHAESFQLAQKCLKRELTFLSLPPSSSSSLPPQPSPPVPLEQPGNIMNVRPHFL